MAVDGVAVAAGQVWMPMIRRSAGEKWARTLEGGLVWLGEGVGKV